MAVTASLFIANVIDRLSIERFTAIVTALHKWFDDSYT